MAVCGLRRPDRDVGGDVAEGQMQLGRASGHEVRPFNVGERRLPHRQWAPTGDVWLFVSPE